MRFLIWLGIAVLITACGGQSVVQDSAPSVHHVDLASIPDAVPQDEPRSRGGNSKSYTVLGRTYRTLDSSTGFVQRGKASWYGAKFHGRKTANGERYNMYAMTAAHKSLPIPTYVRVTNLRNGKAVTVRVNDRGPFHGGRIIDLSYAAAARLDMLKTGTTDVEIRAIDPRQPRDMPSQTVDQVEQEFEPVQPEASTPSLPATVATAPNPPPTKRLFVQVGAYKQVNNAMQMKQQLLTAGLAPVRVHTEQFQWGALYKVQLGPLQDLEAADRIRQSLSEIGHSKVSYVSH